MWGDVGIISERRFVIGKFVITVVLPFCQTSYPARRHPAPGVSQRHVQRRSSNSNTLCVPHRLPADKVLFSISRPYVPSLRQYRPYLKTKHVKDLIEVYYKELTNILSSYEIDAGNIFTLEQLKDSCREAEPSIICTALMYGQFLLMPDEFKKEMMSDK
ncbi:unnamed protein product [Acanthoscelides obtectus]|uniref:Uncharacterized protein n=1 Tax=Acanthoscelides obtectus TaxID=200917 RepID=A0A9P0QA27_ACAOB|nr:unnamed protein product [Acanthoscelides obtectus]CAK1661020.1 hypothetical protein AOBTE_LOCUS22387 [Acanthoscelides obtectus]